MRKLYILFLLTFFSTTVLFSQRTITGTVTTSEDNSPLVGVSILVKGSSRGALTNIDGKYSISATNNDKLIFSYVGMQQQEVSIGDQTTINIVMKPNSKELEEVVVTALGIKQEKRKMNFAVQSVSADALNDSKPTNFVNALQGKIAGLNVTNSGGSPNAGSQVLIRGISSINNGQNNEPLFIMDGVPISGNGSSAADINPDDIENITVLKGAAAAALYGQDAANGVIMITTKKGEKGQLKATFNASLETDIPTRLVKLQNSYTPGAQGFYTDKAMGGWGPLLNSGQKTYDNIKSFLKTGVYQKYNLSLTGGSEKFQSYASASYSKNKGIVPNDYLNRLSVLMNGTYKPIKALTFNFSANLTEKTYRAFSSSGMLSVYNFPITADITNYELTNGYPNYYYYNDDDKKKYSSPISPLYSRYKDYAKTISSRNILSGSAIWNPIKNLNITGRVSYDVSNTTTDSYTVPRWDDSVIYDLVTPTDPGDNATAAQLAQYQSDWAAYQQLYNDYITSPYLSTANIEDMDKDLLGSYYTYGGRSQLVTTSAIATYDLNLLNDISLTFLLGTEVKISDGFSMSNSGRDFIIPGTYSLSNTNSEYVFLDDRTESHYAIRRFGYFGEIRGDYKGMASLSVTSRWDWSSTIITNPYYYPSITGGLLFSELLHLSNDVFSYGKLRGNYAVVGKDAKPYLYDRTYKQFATYPDNGYGIDPTHASADKNLKPEMSYSWELGADLRFFDSKTRLDLAYYSTKTDNQIVTVRVSPTSGYILQVRNEGAIRNHGIELTLEQDIIKNKKLNWVTALNWGLNRGKVVSLPENVAEITGTQYGDIFTSAYLGGSTTAITGKDYLRTDDGKIICDENGYPKIGTDKNKLIGNRESKFTTGITNTFNYKNWTLSVLFDGRLGGDVVNVTNRGLISNGQSSMLETYRGRQVVVDGVVEQADGSYVQNTAPITLDYYTIINYFSAISSNFIEDGSFIRLSYLTLGYNFTKLVNKTPLTGLQLSFTGTNLFLLTKYIGSDPSANANTSAGGTGSAGVDNYATPNTRGFNFNVTVSF